MTNHPSRHRSDDPCGDAAAARVNAIRAARGLPPIVERDPNVVRRHLVDDRDAAMIAVATLQRAGCGATVPDAIDAALVGAPPGSAANMPVAVAYVILQRLPDGYRPAVWAALDDVLERFEATDGSRELAELAVHRIADAVRTALAASIAAAGSSATLHDSTDPATESVDDLVRAADFAAGIVYADLIDRLQRDLATMAGLP